MKKLLTLSLTCLLTLTLAGEVAATSLVPGAGGARFNVKVKSLVDMRFKRVVRQKYDLSCGAAALATLFKYFYGDETDEKQIIDGIMEFGDKEKIEKDGFSMLELKKFGERIGYEAQGYRIKNVESLTKLKIPVLTLTNTRGYNHFVVIKGVRDGVVFIADPAFGNRSVPLDDFDDEWNNVVLVFASTTNGGNNAFTFDPTLRARKQHVQLMIEQGLFHIRPGASEF